MYYRGSDINIYIYREREQTGININKSQKVTDKYFFNYSAHKLNIVSKIYTV